MNRALMLLLTVSIVVALGGTAAAQSPYPKETIEAYALCLERNDLEAINNLLWTHSNVERIDASIYGLPVDDFDDQSKLTITERLEIRQTKIRVGEPLLTSGSLQYPHHLRGALDALYERSGQRPDCSKILDAAGVSPREPEDLGSGWVSDLNLTSFDTRKRGEVDLVIDYANPNRVMASSVSAQGLEGSSDLIVHTTNWGQDWNQNGVGNNAGNSWECDPVSYYQRSTGNAYHSKIGCTSGTCGTTQTQMRFSTDNGSTWADCGRPGTGSSEDRQWHVVDNTATSACYGNIYITWHNSNQEKVSRSTDNCATFTNLTNLTSGGQAITPDINVAADGHAYVAWQNFGDATFKMAGSSDCGVTWASPSAKTVKTRLGDWKNNIPAQCQRGISTSPNIDVDRAADSAYFGRVYMTMFDFDQTGCGSGPGCSNWSSTCDYDIWFTYSDDEGANWATPTNLTSAEGDKVDHFMGYMRVDETDGSIYVSYHRTRLNPTSLADRQKTHYFVKRSIDGGATWQDYQASSLEGDERLSGANGFERGDYNRLDVYAGVAWPVWVDRRDSAGEEEVVVRKLCSEPSHWTERAPTFVAPPVVATPAGSKNINVNWALPDIYWGDADESPASRKFQLWVDGSLEQDNITWTNTSTIYAADECSTVHSFVIRAINQCGISKDYTAGLATATGCCDNNPVVNVTPNGPLTNCVGTAVSLSAGLIGGTGPFTYQWYRDGAIINGATSSTYLANDTGSHTYNCRVMGAGCSDFAADPFEVSLTWLAAPTFAGLETVSNPAAATCTLDLTWSAASTVCAGPISYNVYRSTSSGFAPGPANLISTAITATTFSDYDSLDSGVPQYYVVRARDGSTGGIDTNIVEVAGTPTGPATVGTWTDDAGDTGTAQLTLDAPWTAAEAGGSSGAKVYATGTYPNTLCAAATTPSLHISSGATLSFYSKYGIEDDWDKGEVQISTDGGGAWTRVPVNYPGTATNAYDACGLPTGDYFTGNNTTYVEYTASLATWINQDVMIRWQLSTDDYETDTGWWIDDISITNVTVPSTCTPGTVGLPFLDSFESGDTSAWSAVQQ